METLGSLALRQERCTYATVSLDPLAGSLIARITSLGFGP